MIVDDDDRPIQPRRFEWWNSMIAMITYRVELRET